jgi:dipeptidyl aminopeptidase/acylaminoacyl peptidase
MRIILLSFFCLWALLAETGYQKPPQPISKLLDAPATPQLSVSPVGDRAMLLEPSRYPSIAELSQPMLRLAGLRINPSSNGPFSSLRWIGLTLLDLKTKKQIKVVLPAGVKASSVTWSADGKQFAFAGDAGSGLDLFVGDASTGKVRPIKGFKLNATTGSPLEWLPDQKHLLIRKIPASRGTAPSAPTVPAGPTVQESYGRQAPTWTYQDMLKNSHDEALFDFYCTSQLALVQADSGKVTDFGAPAIFTETTFSPSGEFMLAETVKRPYSYVLPLTRFGSETAVWDRAGKTVYKVAEKGLQDQIPLDGVELGPRNVQWRPTESAALIWVEALDGGDPQKAAPLRDKIVVSRAPFQSTVDLNKTEQRLVSIRYGEQGGLAMVTEYDRNRRWTKTTLRNFNDPGQPDTVFVDRSVNDRYKDVGQPLTKTLPNGFNVVDQQGDWVWLSGLGATPEGDRPFLRQYNLKTRETKEVFRSGTDHFEFVVDAVDTAQGTFVTRYESPTQAPNFFLRTADGGQTQLTNFVDPQPELRGITRKLIKYKRADGVDLSFTLYLPPNYKEGTRLPTFLWAYPLEFDDPSTAGQVTGSPNRFTVMGGSSHLFLLTQGYAVLDNATMPVVGSLEKMNDTYVEQITMSAKAAIDKAAELGVTDPNRVGVGGHSYGAFMTANLLAHTDLFRAGIARSGAYNRTLTPFGFQSERRTFWQARDTYLKVSPFNYADKIKEPILLIHGEADNNTGTFPIQSERMYQAIRGNAGYVRYVTLPHESHGYAARESIEHTLSEMVNWMDKYVKTAAPRVSESGPSAAQ